MSSSQDRNSHVEYVVILGLIAVVGILVFMMFGGVLKRELNASTEKMSGAAPGDGASAPATIAPTPAAFPQGETITVGEQQSPGKPDTSGVPDPDEISGESPR